MPATHDLFLSYNRQDGDTVLGIRTKLEQRGIRTFMDRENLVQGLPWPQALEQALQSSRAIAVFLGPHDFGVWQKREMFFALDLQAQAERENRRLPVIPVLLRNANPQPGFLLLNTWVDFRTSTMETESLETLVRAIQQDGRRARGDGPEICPYMGLRAYREEDQAFYFGRAAFADELVKKVGGHRVVAVVGSSGSGKSSVVLAGLLPRLRRQRTPSWDAITFTPGDNPWWRLTFALIPLLEPDPTETHRIELATALAGTLLERNGALAGTFTRVLERSNGTERLLVVVDQFEELFTLAPKVEGLKDDKARREAEDLKQKRLWFLEDLLTSTKAAPVTVLLTLRADYYGHALDANHELREALNTGQVALGQMGDDDLLDSITQPAAVVGLAFEPSLVTRLLKDVRGQPGYLPLLEYSLTQLWENRQGMLLTSSAYEAFDGLAGAIGRKADSVYEQLPEQERHATRALFGRLVRVSPADAEGADTRQRATRTEIGEIGWQVALKLAGPGIRLLVLGLDGQSKEETAEVAHEALVRSWVELRRWLHEDRDFLIWRQQFQVFNALWEDSGHSAGFLTGSALDNALRWRTAKADNLNEREREFIALSYRITRSTKRQTTAMRVLLGVALAALIAASGWFLYMRTNTYQIRRLLANNLEEGAFIAAEYDVRGKHRITLDSFVTMITLGRMKELKAAALHSKTSDGRSVRLVLLGTALASETKADEAQSLLQQADDLLKIEKNSSSSHSGTNLRIAHIYYDTGRVAEARALTHQLSESVSGTEWTADNLADLGKLVILLGDQSAGTDLLRRAERIASTQVDDRHAALGLIRVAAVYTHLGDSAKATGLLHSAADHIHRMKDFDAQEDAFQDLAGALAKNGQINEALTVATQQNIHSSIGRAYALTPIIQELARIGDTERALTIAAEIETDLGEKAKCLIAVTEYFMGHAQTAKALDVVGKVKDEPSVHARVLRSIVKHLARAGLPDQARNLLSEFETTEKAEKSLATSAVAIAYRKSGRANEADTSLTEAIRLADDLPRSDVHRDIALMPICDAYADGGRYREARLVAERMREEWRQSYVYRNILSAYAGKKNPKFGISVETLLENSPDEP